MTNSSLVAAALATAALTSALTSTASAQSFQYQPNLAGLATSTHAYGAAIEGFDAEETQTNFSFDATPAAQAMIDSGGWGGLAEITNTSISVSAHGGEVLFIPGRGAAETFANFTLDQDAALQLAWDFSNESFMPAESLILLTDDLGNTLLSLDALTNPAGSMTYNLLAGQTYNLTLSAVATDAFGSSTASATLLPTPVPTPGSLALLGAAALAAHRRRR